MRRERSGPGLTEHFLQVEILLGHVWQAPHLILQQRTRNRKTSRHKTRGITGFTPLRDGVATPIHPRIVLCEPGVTQHNRSQWWVGDEKRDSLWVIAWGDEGDGYRGEADLGKWLSIKGADRDLVTEWNHRDVKKLCQGNVQQVTLGSGV